MNMCSGGKTLLVTGENFDSVAKAILTVDVYYNSVFLVKYESVSLYKPISVYHVVTLHFALTYI